MESVRGAGGGYRFSGNPKRVTLLDVIELFEEVGRDAEDSPPVDQDEGRALHKVLREIDDIAIATLSSISITTLLRIVEKQKRGAKGDSKVSARSAAEAPEYARPLGLEFGEKPRRDDEFLDLACAFVDPQRPDLAIELLGNVAVGDAEPAENLYGRVDHFLRLLGREQLRHAGFATDAGALDVLGPGRAVDQQARRRR